MGLKVFATFLTALGVLMLGPLVTLAGGQVRFGGDWSTASRDSAGIAPDPAAHPEALIQVYAARAFNWRAAFGVHTWIAAKPKGAPEYIVFEIIGWRAYRGGDALSISRRAPDTRWFNAPPRVIAELRGPAAEKAIPRLLAAVESYPYRRLYRVWPGPNSNTFTAHVARGVPELRLDLPPTAVGKDYLPGGAFLAPAPSGTGFQFSLLGLVGVLVAFEEGMEFNLLALTAGFDLADMAVKFPGVGRIGLLPTSRPRPG